MTDKRNMVRLVLRSKQICILKSYKFASSTKNTVAKSSKTWSHFHKEQYSWYIPLCFRDCTTFIVVCYSSRIYTVCAVRDDICNESQLFCNCDEQMFPQLFPSVYMWYHLFIAIKERMRLITNVMLWLQQRTINVV